MISKPERSVLDPDVLLFTNIEVLLNKRIFFSKTARSDLLMRRHVTISNETILASDIL